MVLGFNVLIGSDSIRGRVVITIPACAAIWFRFVSRRLVLYLGMRPVGFFVFAPTMYLQRLYGGESARVFTIVGVCEGY